LTGNRSIISKEGLWCYMKVSASWNRLNLMRTLHSVASYFHTLVILSLVVLLYEI